MIARKAVVSIVAIAIAASPISTTVLYGQEAAASSVDPKAAKVAAKAREKQVKAWRKQYGDGPYPDELDPFAATKPEPLRALYRTAYADGEINAVLNLNRLGLAAIENGLWADAERAFDMSLDRIEAVYGKTKDEAAIRARSTFRKESNKDFVGEPYERAMAYYYRGLLYLRVGDYENARAVFTSAEAQDAEADEENARSDFAALNYLIGWSSHCLGQADKAKEAFEVAANSAPGLTAPGAKDNLLMIAELGRGPVKQQQGDYREKLVFGEAEGMPESAAGAVLRSVSGDEVAKMTLIEASDVHRQATTRGSRQVDAILEGKASFKQTTGTVGAVGVAAGLQMMNNAATDPYNNSMGAGMAVAAVGVLFAAFSSASKPEADIRMWDSLPRRLMLGSSHVEGEFKPELSFGDSGLSPVGLMQASAGKCSLAWARSRSVSDLGADAPGADRKIVLARTYDKKLKPNDVAFRARLRGE